MVRVHPDPPQNQNLRKDDVGKGGPTRYLNQRGHSSAGRAPALQAGGHRFDPGWLHQDPNQAWNSARSAAKSALRSEFQLFRLLFKNSEEVKRTWFSQTRFVWVRDCINGHRGFVSSVPTKRFLWSFVWRRAELRVIGSSEQVHVMDALATTGDEGRCSLR